MSDAKNFYLNEYGYRFIFQAVEFENEGSPLPLGPKSIIDISEWTAMRMDFRANTGELASLTHSTNAKVLLLTDGTDGKFYLEAFDGLFVVPGTWTAQAYVTLPTRLWTSDPYTFQVYDLVFNT